MFHMMQSGKTKAQLMTSVLDFNLKPAIKAEDFTVCQIADNYPVYGIRRALRRKYIEQWGELNEVMFKQPSIPRFYPEASFNMYKRDLERGA